MIKKQRKSRYDKYSKQELQKMGLGYERQVWAFTSKIDLDGMEIDLLELTVQELQVLDVLANQKKDYYLSGCIAMIINLKNKELQND